MSDLHTLIVNDKSVQVEGAMTLIQACEVAGIEIPRFCYHERLSIAGNCRMCLVEVVGGPPKPAASCAMQVRDLRKGPEGEPARIKTNSPMVRKAREGVMEFLLINHPLDCPICDQGGECDLQDQAMSYVLDSSRYQEPKRAVDDLDLGPLVETHMVRCISCTRCVRFTTEVAGIAQMGQTGRGEDAEITSYLGETLNSNLQGNIIDLCPVGALVSKPYAFTARPWELTKTESIDVMDALCSAIRIDTKGREVMRILPRNHDGVNEEWISDKTRFVWDGLCLQRLDRPFVREKGKLQPVPWEEALDRSATAISGAKNLVGLVGNLASTEAAFALRQLIERQGGDVECRVDGAKLPIANRSGYVGSAQIEDIDCAKHIVLIGCDPRSEAPVFNARIRKAWLAGAQVALVGKRVELTYDYRHLGDDRDALKSLAEKGHCGEMEQTSVVIVGQAALTDADGEAVLAAAMTVAEQTQSKLMILHTAAGRVGAMDIGAVTDKGLAILTDADVIFDLGADETEYGSESFVIYQGSHGDRGAHRADIILPAACYTEENGTFVNTEGRPQYAFRANFPPGDAKENWAILRALSAKLGAPQSWDGLSGLRTEMIAEVPHLARIDEVPENEWQRVPQGELMQGQFGTAIEDFYLSNPIARASPLMAQLSALSR